MASHDDYRQAFVDELINMVNQDNVKPREIRVKREDAYRLYEESLPNWVYPCVKSRA